MSTAADGRRLRQERLETVETEIHRADPLWYQNAVIYQLHVKSFYDSNDDGIGDFPGLIQRLDYIADLGVNTIWLLPFYPSPRRDDGYDIAGYKGVHSDYGTLADVRRFIAEAHKRGLRVITELVINHTSDQHPWFQRARRAKAGSSWRNFYVWSENDNKYPGTRVIFIDTEKSNWTFDPVANAFYWHRFYAHQPDLNFDNPAVLKAVLGVMRFWLDMGVDGLRLDAVPYLIERDGTSSENLPETHDVLKRIRAALDSEYQGRMLLAEANQWPEDTRQYFGQGDECHMAFHFPLMPRMYMALAQEDRFPITDILRQTPEIPPNCQWAIFLRNHDELTLEMVTDRERDYLWEKYAQDRRARLNLGIRRRLAPLVDRDRRRLELLNSLLLSMPGTPVIYYGDEIGMGDNIHLGDRDGVRTPMQWSPDRNGGFSRADPASLVLPAIMDPLYGFQAINVEAQTRDAHSLLNWTRRMLRVRAQQQAFGRGNLKLMSPANRRVLAYLRELPAQADVPASGCNQGQETILCVANLSRSAQAVELDLSPFAGCVPVEMTGGSAFPPIGQLPYLLTLPPYGFYWFLLASQARMPAWHAVPPEPLPEFVTLVIRQHEVEVLEPPARRLLEQEVLPAYLPKRRWFAAQDERIHEARIVRHALLPGASPAYLLMMVQVRSGTHQAEYLLPAGFCFEDENLAALPQQLALARVRRGRRVGYLTDAFALDAFAHRLVDLMRQGASLPTETGELRFRPTARLHGVEVPAAAEVRRLSAEQSNSSLVLGEHVMLKLIRRLSPGIHPEAEMGRHLTEKGYAYISPFLGELAHESQDGTRHVLAVMQAFIHNQGDAWTWTRHRLEQAVSEATGAQDAVAAPIADSALQDLERFSQVLGRRLGEMHSVLAQPDEDPAFAPQVADEAACASWAADACRWLEDACARLRGHGGWTDGSQRAQAEELVAMQPRLEPILHELARRGRGSLMTRIHGDLHLGQVLVAKDDAYFIDFEGEPAVPVEQRRTKSSPLRDVAGMIRSFGYVAAMQQQGDPALPQMMGDGTAARHVMERYSTFSTRQFLDAYWQASASVTHQWPDGQAPQALIDLFLLQKAAYEIVYEITQRPQWLHVPLQGLHELAVRVTKS